MKRGKPLRRTSLKRVAFGRKTKARDNEFSKDAKALIVARSGGQCEAHTSVCEGQAEHIHHIRRRSQGGKGTVENGLAVCRWCHTFIHEHPQVSEQHGWLKRS